MIDRIPMMRPGAEVLSEGLSQILQNMMARRLEEQRLAQQREYQMGELGIRRKAEERASALQPYAIEEHKTKSELNRMKADLYRMATQGGASHEEAQNLSENFPNSLGGMNAKLMAQLISPSQRSSSPQINKNEIILEQGDPGKYGLDKVAGAPGMREIKTQPLPDGSILKTYPSGKVTQIRYGESPEQKRTSETKEKIAVQQAGQNIKSAAEIKKSVRALIDTYKTASELNDLLLENNDLTGFRQGTRAALNTSKDKNLADFITKTGVLQANIGRFAAPRGGIQAVGWAKTIKPGPFKQPEFNLGMTKSAMENAKNEYETLAAEYKEATGQDLPLKLPEYKPKERKERKKRKWKVVNNQLIEVKQ